MWYHERQFIDAHLTTQKITAVLNYHFIQMKSDGWLEQAWQNHLNRLGDLQCPTKISNEESNRELQTRPLGVKNMAGIFVLHSVLTFVALLLTLWRFYFVHKKGFRDVKISLSCKHSSSSKNNSWETGEECQSTHSDDRTSASMRRRRYDAVRKWGEPFSSEPGMSLETATSTVIGGGGGPDIDEEAPPMRPNDILRSKVENSARISNRTPAQQWRSASAPMLPRQSDPGLQKCPPNKSSSRHFEPNQKADACSKTF